MMRQEEGEEKEEKVGLRKGGISKNGSEEYKIKTKRHK
jgi:hypothetical protein